MQSEGNKDKSRNKIENRKILQKIIKAQGWFFEKVNKISNP